jgi:hypothetical protein
MPATHHLPEDKPSRPAQDQKGTETMNIIRNAIVAGLLCLPVAVHAETVDTRIGKLDFELGVPTKATVAKLYDELDFQRACQVYLWALPAVNSEQITVNGVFVAGARYRPDAHWDYIIMVDPAQDLPGYSQLDERAAYFYEWSCLSKSMVSRMPGVGQAYIGAYRDKNGQALDGGQSYRLYVPPNVPAKQFWSVTLYDVDTRCLIQNQQQIADRSSRMAELARNADGSVDLFFGPAAPKRRENNWIPTVPGKAWFACFRFY